MLNLFKNCIAPFVSIGWQEVLAVQIFGPAPIVGGEKTAGLPAECPLLPTPHSLSNVCTQQVKCAHISWKSKCAQVQQSDAASAAILIQMWNLAGPVTNGCDDV